MKNNTKNTAKQLAASFSAKAVMQTLFGSKCGDWVGFDGQAFTVDSKQDYAQLAKRANKLAGQTN